MAHRTITLTGAPAVRINEDNWPLIANAADREHDGKIECQANRRSKWFIGARQHSDGRAIVYATYTCERGLSAAEGCLLPPVGMQEIADTIRDVCQAIATAEHSAEDSHRWQSLAAECIADLPAEDLDDADNTD